MSIARLVTTLAVVAALALGALAGATPAAAAAGYHAAYFSESSFLTLGPGGTGQFAVGFSNTGDQSWVKGGAGQTSLRTRLSPYDNSQDFAGWGVNWQSAGIYTLQSTDLVAPGQIGFFVYNFKVPTTAAAGPHTFYGIEWLDSEGPLEDYGYYQIVTVGASGLTITSTTPASPSQNQTPTVNGSGAPAGAAVTVAEGSSTLCTATATASGTFSCISGTLNEGSHSLVASAPGVGSSAAFTYVVDRTAPTVTGAATTNASTVVVSFSEAMTCSTGGALASTATGTNYAITTSPTGSAVAETITATPNGACTQASLALSTPLTVGSPYTVTVSNVQDAAGNPINASSRSATFTVTDTGGAPTATASATGAAQITVTYSKPMDTGTTGTAANYRLDSVSCAVSCSGVTTTSTTAVLTFTTAPSVGNHVLDISNVKDSGGTFISPNPTSITVNFSSTSARPTVTSASATTSALVNVGYSTNMDPTTAQTAGNYSIQTNSGNTYSTVNTATCNPSAVSCTSVDLSLATPLVAGAYNAIVTSVKDTFGGFVNPNPSSRSFSFSADATPPAISSISGLQTAIGTAQLSVTFSEAMKHVLACGASGAPTAGPGVNIDNKGDYAVASGLDAAAMSSALTASTAASISSDCRSVTFTLSGDFRAGQYSLTVTGPQDAAGNTLTTTTQGFTFTDNVAPAITSASYGSATQFSVTYNKRMTGGSTVTNSAGNPDNYQVNNLGYGALCTTGIATITANTQQTVWTVTCGAGTGRWGGAGTNSLSVRSVADYNGNVIAPNPYASTF